MQQFYTVITNVGVNKIAKALAENTKVNLTTIKVGDSNGNYYEPNVKQTNLKNIVYSMDVNSIKVNSRNSNWFNVEGIIPANVGGFYIREVGIFDSDGDLIAVGKYSETYKPGSNEGTSKEIIIRMVIEVDNTNEVEFTFNADLSVATSNDLKELSNSVDKYVVTDGAANKYIVNVEDVTELYKGFGLYLEIHETSTGKSTLNVNDLGVVEILDPLGNSISNNGLRQGVPYHVKYNGVNFILQGKGGGGDAIAADIVKGKTATVDTGLVTGTMEQLTRLIGADTTYTNTTVNTPSGGGSQLKVPVQDRMFIENYLNVVISNLTPKNIVKGVKIGGENGIVGTGGLKMASGTAQVDETSGDSQNRFYISTIEFPFENIVYFSCTGTMKAKSSSTATQTGTYDVWAVYSADTEKHCNYSYQNTVESRMTFNKNKIPVADTNIATICTTSSVKWYAVGY